MKTRIITLTMLLALLFGAVLVPTQTALAQGGVTVPITGTFPDGTFEGTLTLTRFLVQDGELVVRGLLEGDLTNTVTGIVTEVSQTITLPVSNISSTCEILHLELGPLDLDLLGLVVHLDQVVLDITAEQGGGLLGDLLCSIANLLNNQSPLTPLVRLLNNILRILGE